MYVHTMYILILYIYYNIFLEKCSYHLSENEDNKEFFVQVFVNATL